MMDKIIRITIGLFLAVLIVFVASVGYTIFVDNAYRTSLNSTYSYSCSITTDSVLSNVTFFIPVPANPQGNSPVEGRISAKDITGLPGDWETTLYDTGKATLVKITASKISPPGWNGTATPYTIRFSANVRSPKVIDTRTPLTDDAVFRPVQGVKDVACPQDTGAGTGSPRCIEYLTSIYASYSADPNASLSISSRIIGRNEWKIFEPHYSEYRNTIDVLMFGDNHGWTTTKGWLESGIGFNDAPIIKS
jgi:hypothetical protein